MHYPSVTIIILNWNGWKDTIQCLESVSEVTYPNYNIILVDNGSTDDSCVQLTSYLKTKTGREIRLQKDVSTNTSRREENSQKSARGQIERLRPSDQSWKNFAFMKNEQNYGFAKEITLPSIMQQLNMKPTTSSC